MRTPVIDFICRIEDVVYVFTDMGLNYRFVHYHDLNEPDERWLVVGYLGSQGSVRLDEDGNELSRSPLSHLHPKLDDIVDQFIDRLRAGTIERVVRSGRYPHVVHMDALVGGYELLMSDGQIYKFMYIRTTNPHWLVVTEYVGIVASLILDEGYVLVDWEFTTPSAHGALAIWAFLEHLCAERLGIQVAEPPHAKGPSAAIYVGMSNGVEYAFNPFLEPNGANKFMVHVAGGDGAHVADIDIWDPDCRNLEIYYRYAGYDAAAQCAIISFFNSKCVPPELQH